MKTSDPTRSVQQNWLKNGNGGILRQLKFVPRSLDRERETEDDDARVRPYVCIVSSLEKERERWREEITGM